MVRKFKQGDRQVLLGSWKSKLIVEIITPLLYCTIRYKMMVSISDVLRLTRFVCDPALSVHCRLHRLNTDRQPMTMTAASATK